MTEVIHPPAPLPAPGPDRRPGNNGQWFALPGTVQNDQPIPRPGGDYAGDQNQPPVRRLPTYPLGDTGLAGRTRLSAAQRPGWEEFVSRQRALAQRGLTEASAQIDEAVLRAAKDTDALTSNTDENPLFTAALEDAPVHPVPELVRAARDGEIPVDSLADQIFGAAPAPRSATLPYAGSAGTEALSAAATLYDFLVRTGSPLLSTFGIRPSGATLAEAREALEAPTAVQQLVAAVHPAEAALAAPAEAGTANALTEKTTVLPLMALPAAPPSPAEVTPVPPANGAAATEASRPAIDKQTVVVEIVTTAPPDATPDGAALPVRQPGDELPAASNVPWFNARTTNSDAATGGDTGHNGTTTRTEIRDPERRDVEAHATGDRLAGLALSSATLRDPARRPAVQPATSLAASPSEADPPAADAAPVSTTEAPALRTDVQALITTLQAEADRLNRQLAAGELNPEAAEAARQRIIEIASEQEQFRLSGHLAGGNVEAYLAAKSVDGARPEADTTAVASGARYEDADPDEQLKALERFRQGLARI